jgi:aspartate 1-decarboxylase
VQPGDRVIVITYADYDEQELRAYEPLIVHVDDANRVIPEQDAVTRIGSNVVYVRRTATGSS